jgi:hypothetical protein
MVEKSQKEVFKDAYKELSNIGSSVALQLISDMYDRIYNKDMILKQMILSMIFYFYFHDVGQYADGSDVAIITCGVHCKYLENDCYINMNILYPLLGLPNDKVRVFLLKTDSTILCLVNIDRYYHKQTMWICYKGK